MSLLPGCLLDGGAYVLAWATARGVRHSLNEAGSPTQNAYIESFNGKFRDKCLNEHWFETLKQARLEIASWRTDYNEVRPHSSCGPSQNAFFERFNRSLREEVLDAWLFNAVSEVPEAADGWMVDYNECRPHESLGNVPPAAFRPSVFNADISTSGLST